MSERTVLIVDDESDVGMIFSKIVAEHGFQVRHCASVEEAIPVVQSGAAMSLLFLDIRLPGIDGISAISKFLSLDPGLPIIMMTAYQTVETIVTAMRLGAVDFLVKPLDSQIIVQAVQKYARKEGVGTQAAPSSLRPPASQAPGTATQPVTAAARARSEKMSPDVFVAETPHMKGLLTVAEKFASVDGPVLILGESGTGKELLAHYIHRRSPRGKEPLVIVDCTSIPESLFESELFGYEKGAFTGADNPKEGRFELANHGTLFLDEIGNVPLTMQAKLLRFMEEHTISRLGGKKSLALDIRLITATNAELQNLVEKGNFREDLYYRLSALTIHLPPLRNRVKEEKESLIHHILQKNAQELKKPVPLLSDSALDVLLEYPWPGNVRELENALYSSSILSTSRSIEVTDLPIGIQSYFSHKEQVTIQPDSERKTLKDILRKVEREQILSALKQTGGNKKKASEILDMDYKTFLTKLKDYV
ncbi:MAG: sigma-54-dependent Fis family transcriptional regulator [Elusimicrobia bacterium]|nr:sigma-54-dependent Fis family transcriptional regulator [Elusimicrobiota bacterium]